jgi:hypothetical protein
MQPFNYLIRYKNEGLKNKTILLIAIESFGSLQNSDLNIHRISSVNKIFPTLFKLKPDIIVIDYDF